MKSLLLQVKNTLRTTVVNNRKSLRKKIALVCEWYGLNALIFQFQKWYVLKSYCPRFLNELNFTYFYAFIKRFSYKKYIPIMKMSGREQRLHEIEKSVMLFLQVKHTFKR